MEKITSRYSQEELLEFKTLIEHKLEKERKQLTSFMKQLEETSENNQGDHGADWLDDSSNSETISYLNNSIVRLRKHIVSLENALKRIENKSFGICVVTGKLIDKKRLLAVPTTTKSIEGKDLEARSQRV